MPRSSIASGRQEPVAEVPLRRGARAHGGPVLREKVQLPLVGVRGVDYRGVRAEEAGLCEQLDRPHTVLLPALFDLTQLLVCVDVYGEIMPVGRTPRSPPATLEEPP